MSYIIYIYPRKYLTMFNPFSIYNDKVKTPVVNITKAVINHYTKRINARYLTVKDILLRGAIVALATSIIVWLAIFMYIVFYYTYMPSISHIRPVHLQFKSCEEGQAVCSFPSAHVSLTKKQQLLMIGQPYKVYLYIEMPESDANKNLGMFMVCAEMRDTASKLRGHSCRSAMLHYRSDLLHSLNTLALSPLLIIGTAEQKQIVPVELFSNYEEDQNYPVTDVYVEIQSRKIEFYSASLHITAHFTGLRYIMFHWPILSAAIGISTNLFFIALVCLLSWYHMSDTTWLEEVGQKCMTKIRRSKSKTVETEDSSVEDISLCESDTKETELRLRKAFNEEE
ncbi:seipin [Ctenocephalides felis]|uniref:seipin n=1 Tax=Ctenocephalides felis TaxID=7515 RepID=UPI000E6E3853|nr:seipin [Ctenocephalides felis]